jgi:hypothetical protein
MAVRDFASVRLVVLVASIGLVLSGCSGPCHLVLCVGSTIVRITDSSGQPVRGLRGSVGYPDGTAMPIDCPEPDTGSCSAEGLRLERLSGSFEVDLQAGSLGFKGTVTPTYTTTTFKDFNGPGCGDCRAESGQATLTLKPF